MNYTVEIDQELYDMGVGVRRFVWSVESEGATMTGGARSVRQAHRRIRRAVRRRRRMLRVLVG